MSVNNKQPASTAGLSATSTTRIRLHAVMFLSLAIVPALLLQACGGRGDAPEPISSSRPVLATQHSGMDALPSPSGEELALARTEISRLEQPTGVDSDVWQQLGDALIESLQSRGTSKLPNESRNVIDDLQWIDNGGGDFNLEWTFRNAGDYDNNGEVNVSDLSAIGVHFGRNESSSNWDTARTADGDGNGEINIADVSPIGVNFGSQVLGYNVYASDYEDGPWILQGSISLEEATTGFPRMFSYAYGAQEHAYVTVVPFDTASNDHIKSDGGNTSRFIPGESTIMGSAVVDYSTGAELLGDAGTPLEGVTVSIPAGAMNEPTEISIGYADGNVLPVAGTWGGVILEISGPSVLDFDEPVLVTVPFSGGPEDVPVPYYVNGDGRPEACTITQIDRGAGTMTFMTLHTSWYYWIVGSSLPDSYHTGFNPGKHGFQIVNYGSSYELSGECMGMSAFAGWYFEQQKRGNVSADLYPSFLNIIGNDPRLGQPIRGQDAIATRAHISVNSMWNYYLPSIAADVLLKDQWTSIRNTIVETGNPTIIHMSSLGSGNHLVLATGYTEDSLLIYDPNFPNEENSIGIMNGNWENYESAGLSFAVYKNVGTGTIRREAFNNILADAEDNFQGTEDAVIVDLSHSSGQQISDDHVVLVGFVESGAVLVEEIEIDTGIARITKPVDPVTGRFATRVPLQTGDNLLDFITRGRDSSNNSLEVPNNFTHQRGLLLRCSFPPTQLKVTLTWDEDIPFMMEVTDPSGDIASNTAGAQWDLTPTTEDGGYIDGSVFNGGPLYFIIPENAILRSGEYKVRVLNFSSSQDEVRAANWTVAVSVGDGPASYYTGRLNIGTKQYVDPDDFGAYWSKYITFTP